MKIWAHRGCSQRYPENTLLAFEKASGLKELEGIELDIQLTKDGQLVVIHDERVDRTTEGIGFVRDFTLSELRKLHIYAGDGPRTACPVFRVCFAGRHGSRPLLLAILLECPPLVNGGHFNRTMY